MDHPAVPGEAAGAVGHQSPPLGAADRLAEIGLAGAAEATAAAFRGVKRNHVVAHSHRGHPLAELHHHGAALMAQHRRKEPLGIRAREGVGIGVAHPCGHHLQQHLPGPGRGHVDLGDLERFTGSPGHGCSGANHGRMLIGSPFILAPISAAASAACGWFGSSLLRSLHGP